MARQPLRTLALLLAALLLAGTCSAAHDTRLSAAGRRALLADAAASGTSAGGGNITANAGAAAIHSAVEEVEVVAAVRQQEAYDVAFCRDQRNRAGMSGLFVGALMGGCAVYCLLAARHSAGGHGHGAAVSEGQATQALDADDLKQRLTRLKALQAATSA